MTTVKHNARLVIVGEGGKRTPICVTIGESFIYLYLTYCVEIWGNACNIHLDPNVKLQKQCMCTITMYSSYLEHTQLLFDSLNILCFQKLVIQRISLITC